jgi:hypothetical protein
MHTLLDQFYIPLVDINVDVDKVRQEIYNIVKPQIGIDCGLTCQLEDLNNDNFSFTKYTGQRKFNPHSRHILATGEDDRDLVHWPRSLQGSYIQQLGTLFSEYLEIGPPRARSSLLYKDHANVNLNWHVDNHTPYRVHIAIETTPECLWKFRNDTESLTVHQPITSTPVLIQTAIQHDIHVPKGHRRLHIWYQFHSEPKKELIDNLIAKYQLTQSNI